jgi:hypothetical protein
MDFIYRMYTPDCWFWELIEMIRKFILTAAMLLVQDKSLAQLIAALGVSVFFLVAHVASFPFVKSSSNMLQSLCLLSVLVTLFFAIVSKYGEDLERVNAPVLSMDQNPSPFWVIIAIGLTFLYMGYLVIGVLLGLMSQVSTGLPSWL